MDSRLKETESEQQRLLEQLEAGRNILQAVLEQMPAAVIIAEPSSGSIILSNRRAEELWQQPPGFLTDMEKFWQIPRYHPDGRAHQHEEIPLVRALTRGETVVDEEMLLERETGDRDHYIHLNVNAAPVRDSQGKIIAGVVTFLDITQRRQAELALRQSQEQLQLLLESTDKGIYGIDLDGGCTFINRAALEMLQYSRSEVMGRNMHNLIHHTHPKGTPYPEADCPVHQVLSKGIGAQLDDEVLWRKDGSVLRAHYSSYPLKSEGRIIGAVVSFSNITARKEAEEALLEGEERFRTLVELAPDIIYRLDEEGRILFISPAVRQLGYQPEDLVGRKFEEIVYPEDRQRAPHTFVERRIGERATKNLEVRLTTKEGDLRDYSLNFLTFSLYSRGVWNVPDDQIMRPEKKFLCSQGIARDISDHKRAQEELREQSEILRRSEARFRTLFETSRDALSTIAPPSWRFTSCNPAMILLFGARDEADFISRFPWQYSPERQPDGCDSADKARELIETAMCEGSCFFEWTHARVDGTEFPTTVLLTRMEFAGETILHATVRDISPQKRAEEALKKNAAFLNTLLNTIPAPVFFKDAEGRYLGFNKAFETYYGKPGAELVGKSVFDIAPKEIAEIYHAKDAELYHNPGVQVYEAKLKDAHDQLHDVMYHKATFMNPDGKIGGLIGVILDITDLKRVQEALIRAKEEWERTFDAVPDLIAIMDLDHRITKANRAMVTRLGASMEQIIGSPCYKIVHHQDHTTQACPYRQLLADGQEHSVEVYEENLGGYFIVTVSPLQDSAGKMVGVVHVARDISERKRAEELLAWQTRVDSGLVQLSAELLVEPSVEEFSDLVLKEAQQLTDSPNGFVGYLDPQTGYLVCPTLTRDILTSCQIQDGEVVFKDFRGLWGWVLNKRRPLLTNTPDSDPRSTGVPEGHAPISRFLSAPALLGNELVGQVALANTSRDYTDQDLTVVKRLADLFALAIQRHRTELALQAASDAAEAANRAKSDFLSSMSHELRTPMNAIIGFSEILQDQHFGPLNEKQSRQINHILTSGRHLLSLINDILDLSKVESGKMELELSTVRIAGLLEGSLVMIKEKALRHQLQLETDLAPDLADLRMVADERRLKQIMFNLLSNAAKYTPDGGEIKVTAKREAGNLVVSVTDTGIGIAPEVRERIFEAFEQVDSSYARQQEGTGLGLALTRRMVELHGGKIWVESAGKDQGSTFIFIIPLRSGVEPETLPKNNV